MARRGCRRSAGIRITGTRTIGNVRDRGRGRDGVEQPHGRTSVQLQAFFSAVVQMAELWTTEELARLLFDIIIE